MKKASNKKKNNKFYKILSFILLIFTIFSFSILLYFDVLPIKYLIIGGILLSVIILFIIYKLNIKTCLFTKLLCVLLTVVFIFIELLGTIYAFGTIDFFNNIFDTGYQSESYGVYVINKDLKLKDLNNKKIGIKNDEESNINKALDKLKSKIKYELLDYESITDMVKDLKEEKINGIFINVALMDSFLQDHDEELTQIYTTEILVKNEGEFKTVNVTKKPFAIYLSGVDTIGRVNQSARSDVNIVAYVNPITGKILLVNTPRDYYLTLYSKNAKDKLTHAGIYGVNESTKSLELLYDTEINYYVRINFTSFIKIIDNLGGITVDVEKPDYRYNRDKDCGIGYICEQNSKREWDDKTIYIKSGKNVKLNGEQALAYARNRHQFANGDNARGYHQQQIIKAMIEKIVSPTIITKYNTILKDLSKGIITNIDQKTITKLINFELDTNKKWDIEMVSSKGTNGFDICYSLGKYKAYVLVPDEDNLNEVKDKIKEIIS